MDLSNNASEGEFIILVSYVADLTGLGNSTSEADLTTLSMSETGSFNHFINISPPSPQLSTTCININILWLNRLSVTSDAKSTILFVVNCAAQNLSPHEFFFLTPKSCLLLLHYYYH